MHAVHTKKLFAVVYLTPSPVLPCTNIHTLKKAPWRFRLGNLSHTCYPKMQLSVRKKTFLSPHVYSISPLIHTDIHGHFKTHFAKEKEAGNILLIKKKSYFSNMHMHARFLHFDLSVALFNCFNVAITLYKYNA